MPSNDLIDVHFITLKLLPKFPDIDRAFLTLAVMRVYRSGQRPEDLDAFQAKVREVLKEFGGPSGKA